MLSAWGIEKGLKGPGLTATPESLQVADRDGNGLTYCIYIEKEL